MEEEQKGERERERERRQGPGVTGRTPKIIWGTGTSDMAPRVPRVSRSSPR
jgi:hypothetical protein